jgi:hypothetical protein
MSLRRKYNLKWILQYLHQKNLEDLFQTFMSSMSPKSGLSIERIPRQKINTAIDRIKPASNQANAALNSPKALISWSTIFSSIPNQNYHNYATQFNTIERSWSPYLSFALVTKNWLNSTYVKTPNLFKYSCVSTLNITGL